MHFSERAFNNNNDNDNKQWKLVVVVMMMVVAAVRHDSPRLLKASRIRENSEAQTAGAGNKERVAERGSRISNQVSRGKRPKFPS